MKTLLLIIFLWGGASKAQEVEPSAYDFELGCIRNFMQHCAGLSEDCQRMAFEKYNENPFKHRFEERVKFGQETVDCVKGQYNCANPAFTGYCERWAKDAREKYKANKDAVD